MAKEGKQMKLGLLTGKRAGEQIDLGINGVTIGREEDNDVFLNEDGISRYHARIFVKDGAWTVEDSGSTNGVYLNGERISEPRPLQNGDQLHIYNQRLLFGDSTTIRNALAAGAESDSSGAAATSEKGIGAPAGSTSFSETGSSAWTEKIGLGLRIAVFAGLIGVLLYLGLLTFSSEEDSAKKSDEENKAASPVAETRTSTDTTESDVASTEEESDVSEADQEEAEGITVFAGKQPEEGEGEGEGEGEESEETASSTTASDEQTATGTETEKSSPEEAETPPSRQEIKITTDPVGATVFLDDAELGSAPLKIPYLPEGRHRLRFEKNGYESLTRNLQIPEPDVESPYSLNLKPGTVYVTSEPTGAAILRGNQFLGHTPKVLDNLPEGEKELIIAAVAYENQKVTVNVKRTEGKKVEATLQPKFGGLEIVTSPPNCEIVIDGHVKGATQAAGEFESESRPLRIKGLPRGRRLIKVKHPAGIEQQRAVNVKAEEITEVSPVKLWVINTKLVLEDGNTVKGKLIEKNEKGDVILELSPGNMERYLEPQYENIERLDTESARKAMQEYKTREGKMNVGEDGSSEEKKRFKASALEDLLAQEPRKFYHTIKSKEIIISGKIRKLRGSDGLGIVTLGQVVRCFFPSEEYTNVKDRLQQAEASGAEITVTGKVMGFNENPARLMLRNCELLSD